MFLVPAKMDNTPSSCFTGTKSSACRSVCEEKCRTWPGILIHGPEKVYTDPVQTGVRIGIGRALVEAFDLFTYKQNRDTGRYVPQLPLCQESLKHEVIDYVTKQAANVMFKWGRKIEELKEEGNKSLAEDCQDQLDKFKVTLSRISYGFLAQHLLNTLSTFKVGKNWNSVGAGASVCQLAAAISTLDNASKGSLVDINFLK